MSQFPVKMEEDPVDTVSDEEEEEENEDDDVEEEEEEERDEEETSSSESDSEELPEINLPGCSRRNSNTQQESSDSSSESESEESSTSSDSSEASSGPAIVRPCTGNGACEASKRALQARRLELDAKRRKLEEEKEARKLRLKDMQIYRPGQCMNHIHVEIHPTLGSAWFMADVARELEAAGAKIHATPMLVNPGLIVWTRLVPRRFLNVEGQAQMSTSKVHCGMSLYVCSLDEVAERVADASLLPHIDSLREMVDGDLSVVVFGDFKSSGRRTANSSRKTLTELQMEQIKIDLLISAGVDVRFMDKTSDLAMWVMHCTKAVAEAPFKNTKRELDYAASGFYMRGDNRRCVAVDKDGHGVGQLWQQMMSVLPNSSLEIARTLCNKYKSPTALIHELERAYGPGELADTRVVRAGVPDCNSRRVGPEFARKLHLLFTSRNGNILVE